MANVQNTLANPTPKHFHPSTTNLNYPSRNRQMGTLLLIAGGMSLLKWHQLWWIRPIVSSGKITMLIPCLNCRGSFFCGNASLD